MATPTVYVLCDNNCKYEGMTKEQILAAITQAVESGTIGNCDTGFITTIKTINGLPLKFFVGTQAEYDLLSKDAKQNLFAIITNDTTKEGLLNAINELSEKVTNIDTKVDSTIKSLENGGTTVKRASIASTSTIALTDKNSNAFTDKYLRTNGITRGGVQGDLKEGGGVLIHGSPNGTFYHAYIKEATYGALLDLGVVWWDGESTVCSPVTSGIAAGVLNLYRLTITPTGDMGGVPMALATVDKINVKLNDGWSRCEHSGWILHIVPMMDTPEPSLMA